MARWHVACDACAAGGWIGPREGALDAWCEGCQRPATLAAAHGGAMPPRCQYCGTALTVGAPHFEEVYGQLQDAAAVVAAWKGDPEPLGRMLPERPRYLTDLTPPESRADDPREVRAALATLARGRFEAAREALAKLARVTDARALDPRLWLALGIACHRTGRPKEALAAYGRVLVDDPLCSAARLDRGALLADAMAWADARRDFAQAGERHEARWDRAALLVEEAVRTRAGLPDAATLAKARALAPPASSYWSDHTLGRLIFTLLLERAHAAVRRGEPAAEAALRAAEGEFEFDTYWDLAIVVHGYATLGMGADLARVASGLALRTLDALLAEPCLAGPAGAELRDAVGAARAAAAAGRPADAHVALAALLERPDVRAYRVSCVTCGAGSLGVDGFEEGAGDGDGLPDASA